ncbi:MAG: Uma2 family endonuclease [Nostocaceae cyanobacterium]|nr:Uma2 family endonuclease [Nostocaceae cyanobacterium]
MTSLLPTSSKTEIFYPSSDGEPLAESYVHLQAIIATLLVLTQYLQGRQATVLADQFLYYAQGFPRLRVAPDVMVIFNVAPGGRDNYKIWEEGEVPVVIFEVTSRGTKENDTGHKKILYAQLGVPEYWLFDPKGEWIEEKLRGYRLRGEEYELITDSRSEPLQLRLQIESQLIGFYREDTGEKLLIPEELAVALQQEKLAREQEKLALEQTQEQARLAQLQVEKLQEQLRALGIDPEAK